MLSLDSKTLRVPALEAVLPQHLVAIVVATALARNIGIGRLDWPVRRCIGQVCEEWLAVPGMLLQVSQHLVRVVGRGIEVLWHRHHLAIVAIGSLHAARATGLYEMISPALQQYEGALEAFYRRTLIILEAQMPLASHVRVVTRCLQTRGQRDNTMVEVVFVPGCVCHGHTHAAFAGTMMVGAGHQHCPGGGTQRRRVVVRQNRARRSQTVQIGRTNLSAEGAEIRVAHVISDDHQHIGPGARCEASRLGRHGHHRPQGKHPDCKPRHRATRVPFSLEFHCDPQAHSQY